MFELGRVVPLRTGRDFERAHFLNGVDGGHVERQRVETAADEGFRGSGEIAMPRLEGGAGAGDIEADLDDLVVLAENRFRHRLHPRMGGEFDEAADIFGVDFDVVAFRSATDGAARPFESFFEKAVDVLAKIGDPGSLEGSFQTDDAVAVETAHDSSDVVLGGFGSFRGRRHRVLLHVGRLD